MADQISEADIWLSRVNIAQARSQKLLQSWLPASASPTSTPAEDGDEDDFVGMTESAGLGTAPKESEFEVDGVLKRRHASSNDKLLEQLLGKKAAAAKRKEQALAKQSKSNIALGRAAAPLPATGTPAPAKSGASSKHAAPSAQDSEDEDEPGRAATFIGKKVTRYAAEGQGRRDTTPMDEDTGSPDLREDAATIRAMKNGISQAAHDAATSEEEDQRPRKKKATSYLDELLSKNKKKKTKRKGKM